MHVDHAEIKKIIKKAKQVLLTTKIINTRWAFPINACLLGLKTDYFFLESDFIVNKLTLLVGRENECTVATLCPVPLKYPIQMVICLLIFF